MKNNLGKIGNYKWFLEQFDTNQNETVKEGKWEDWVKDQEEKRWEAVLAEYESEMEEIEKADGAFDKTVANAIANNEHRK